MADMKNRKQKSNIPRALILFISGAIFIMFAITSIVTETEAYMYVCLVNFAIFIIAGAFMKDNSNKRQTAKTNSKEDRSIQEMEEELERLKYQYFDEIIVLDTETTGVDYEDEILQLSIIDGHGNILFDQYFKPSHHKEWPEAEAVNNISPEMVKDNKPIWKYKDEIISIISSKVIVGYNVTFDLKMIGSNLGFFTNDYIDVMEPFAKVYGEYDSYHGDYRWQKLTTCARYYGYKWDKGDAHDALSDCFATLHCYKEMFRRGQI